MVEDTPSKKQQYTRSERMKETMKRRRSRIDSNRNGNGISVVAESPERKTRYYSGIPDLSVTTSDSFNESSLFKRALSGKLLRNCFTCYVFFLLLCNCFEFFSFSGYIDNKCRSFKIDFGFIFTPKKQTTCPDTFIWSKFRRTKFGRRNWNEKFNFKFTTLH